MNSVTLFIIGIIAFAILKLLFGWTLDNSGKIDLEKEKELTRNMKCRH